MTGVMLRITGMVALVTIGWTGTTQAQISNSNYVAGPAAHPGIVLVEHQSQPPANISQAVTARPIVLTNAETNPAAEQPGVAPKEYVQLDAPLNPYPVQTVPSQVGSTLITTPVLAPQEMLYPHEYRAMYPPYYYKVRGSWLWTPFGIHSKDTWKLQGTEVSVKYKSRVGLFKGFVPPTRR